MEPTFKIKTDIEEVVVPRRSTKMSKPIAEVTKLFEEMDCFPDLKQMILAGWPPSKVAEFMITQFPDDFEKLDKSEDELSGFIADYRKKISAAELISVRMPEEFAKAKERLKAGLNITDELESLYKMQKERIEIDYNTEKKINKLFKGTGGEIEIASKLLREYFEVQQELGLHKPDANVDATIRTRLITDYSLRYGKESVNKVLADPSRVAKILKFADNMFQNLNSDDAMKLLATAKEEIVENPEVEQPKEDKE